MKYELHTSWRAHYESLIAVNKTNHFIINSYDFLRELLIKILKIQLCVVLPHAYLTRFYVKEREETGDVYVLYYDKESVQRHSKVCWDAPFEGDASSLEVKHRSTHFVVNFLIKTFLFANQIAYS